MEELRQLTISDIAWHRIQDEAIEENDTQRINEATEVLNANDKAFYKLVARLRKYDKSLGLL